MSDTGLDPGPDGFRIAGALPSGVTQALTVIAEDLGPVATPFSASSVSLPRAEARRVDVAIKDVLTDPLRDLFGDVEPFLAAVIAKAPHSGVVTMHQDWTYTDERVAPTLVCWIPLVDVGVATGALRFVPGSHRWSDAIRPSGGTEWDDDLVADLVDRAVMVPMAAGEVVAYHPATIHGSSGNEADVDRPVIAVAVVPTGTEIVHFALASGRLRGAIVDESWFTTHPFAVVPDDAPVLQPWVPAVTAAEIRTGMDKYPAGPTSGASRAAEGSRLRGDAGATQIVLRDVDADARLRCDGYVVLDLLDGEESAALRDGFGRLHGWAGVGFHADLTVADAPYRSAVDDALCAALDEKVSELFHDHRPFLRNYLCKWPGEGSELYLHQDWMYVDERSEGSTFVVWIALDEASPERGALQVHPGSHATDDHLRGTDLITPLILEPPPPEAMVTVAAAAGQCVIMNNALVRGSPPNRSDRPRVTAAVGMRPASAPLVYFRRADERTALRFDIDERFFLRHTPADLHADPPAGLEPAEVVVLPPRPVDVDVALPTAARPARRLVAAARDLTAAVPRSRFWARRSGR